MRRTLILALVLSLAPIAYTSLLSLTWEPAYDFALFAVTTMGKAQAAIMVLVFPIWAAMKVHDWLTAAPPGPT